jgi:hypothetical protein
MNDPKYSNAKVLFRVVGEDGSVDVETLWAYDLGNENYKLDNSPFFAYGVSCGDTVEAPFNASEGFPVFKKVVIKSGYRTVRVLFDPPIETGNESDAILKELANLGSEYEGANPKYLTLSIPSKVDFKVIVQYLIDKKLKWEHVDPTYDEYHGVIKKGIGHKILEMLRNKTKGK